MTPYYPIFLNVSGKKCIVVGGGEVALRKVEALLGHGAEVTVISPELCSGLSALARQVKIQVIERRYATGSLDGALMVIAATDDRQTNLAVAEEAKKAAVPVNVVDDPASSDFIVPSCLSRGDITIAVSTAGKSPALARKIRCILENNFGDEYALLASLVEEVRAELKRQGIQVDGDGWQEALNLDLLLELLKKGEAGKARAVLLDNLKSLGRLEH